MSDINKTYVFETVLVSGSTSGSTGGSFADDYTITAELSGSTINFTRLSGGTYSVDLSSLSVTGVTNGPITFSAETSGTTTWVGYGTINACKIRKIDTVSGSTYTAFWSNGEEDLNKIWVNRYTYSYF
tara:strand:+ start:2150 stop:2533 length:384 start_codon:yes stop_codon:yes gene_type:complete